MMAQCKGQPCGSIDLHQGHFDKNWRCMKPALPGSRYCSFHRSAETGGAIISAVLLILGAIIFVAAIW